MKEHETGRILLTAYRGHIICARYCDFRMTDAAVIPKENPADLHVGDIRIGKVLRLSPQTNGAFLSLGSGADVYLSLDEPSSICYTSGDPDRTLRAGDELIVQVSREAHGQKNALVSANIMFSGNGILLMSGKSTLGISVKIPESRKKELRHLIASHMPEGFGVIVRTNAQQMPDDDILSELDRLRAESLRKLEEWRMRTCFSLLERGPGEMQAFLEQHLSGGVSEILTDLPEQYESTAEFLKTNPQYAHIALRLYSDSTMPLQHIYKTDAQLDKALEKKVWLKSGAFLVIEQTEAMAVIDVNSGKITADRNRKKTQKEEAVLKVNLEAASEAARQIRLRNLSGIIVIDFIDMKKAESRAAVLEKMRNETADDPAGVHVEDITALQLCELTRKRIRRPLREQIFLDAEGEKC